MLGSDSGDPALVRVGKTLYVIEDGAVYVPGSIPFLSSFDFWSFLPEADRKAYAELVQYFGGDVPIAVNPDGSVMANSVLSFPGVPIQYHTNACGAPLEFGIVFKYGGKWHSIISLMEGSDTFLAYTVENGVSRSVTLQFKVKNGTELVGVYDSATGKPASGVFYYDDDPIIFLKNGKPLTGKQTDPNTGLVYQIPADFGFARSMMD